MINNNLNSPNNFNHSHLSAPKVTPLFTLFAILFIILMHISLPSGLGVGLEQSNNNTTWIAVCFIIAFIFYYIVKTQQILYNPLTLSLLLGCTILTIPLIYPDADLNHSALRFIGLWAGVLLFIGLQQLSLTQQQQHLLLYLILIGVMIEGFFSWYQYLIVEGPNWMGYDYIKKRPTALLGQANIAATFFITGFVLSAYLLAHCKKNTLKGFLIFIPLLISPLVIILASRLGWLTLFLSFILIIPYLLKANRSLSKLWILSTLLGVTLGIMFSFFPHLFGSDLFGSFGTQRSISGLNGRSFIYQQALMVWKDHFIFGIGYGNYRSSVLNIIGTLYQQGKSIEPGSEFTNYPHNEILYWAIEGGILGLLGILFIMAIILKQIIQLPWRTAFLYIALFLPITLHLQLEFPFYLGNILWIIFIIFIYLLNSDSTSYRNLKSIPLNPLCSYILKYLSILSCTLIPSLLLLILISNYYLTLYERNPINKEGRIDPYYLEKVITLLPIIDASRLVRYRYEWDLNLSFLREGLQYHNRDQIQKFIDWAETKENYRDRVKHYQFLFIAYSALNQSEKAWYIWSRGHFLFPKNKFFIRYPQDKKETSQLKSLT